MYTIVGTSGIVTAVPRRCTFSPAAGTLWVSTPMEALIPGKTGKTEGFLRNVKGC